MSLLTMAIRRRVNRAGKAAVAAFQAAARDVPAYQKILKEKGIDPANVKTLDDFRRLVPVIDKRATFIRFPVARLCRGGKVGDLAGVLTSSGHSGQFAFGLYDAQSAGIETERIDTVLDELFHVGSKKTLLINCLPMGVKVYTNACTVGETSVRADMVNALAQQFAGGFDQVILVGDAAFIKHVLELGRKQGVPWHDILTHVVVSEETLAETARTYLRGLLGIDRDRPQTGLIYSSMGVAELGLNLFYEVPQLTTARWRLHKDAKLRRLLLGQQATCVPMLFTHDPARIFVEVLEDKRLVITTLDKQRRLPLIRYATGDIARWLVITPALREAVAASGLRVDLRKKEPVLMVFGREQFALAGKKRVSPEQVKEGLYHNRLLAGKTTANFRLSSGATHAKVRIQLSPGVNLEPGLAERFRKQISKYVKAPLTVTCQRYDTFSGGRRLDYERKFDYLGS